MAVQISGVFVRECVSCKRCFPPAQQFCSECFIELVSLEPIPPVINARYELARVVNQGATGVVFAANDLQTMEEVALKVLRASAVADMRACDRLLLEAGLAQKLNHPQIAAVYDFGILSDVGAYVVTELVHGTSLRQAMKRTGKFPVPRAVALLSIIAEALDEAHQSGLVHRDLQPESIILLPVAEDEPPQIKLVDFSFSRTALGHQFIPGTTKQGQARGQLPRRPHYLSPEQIRGVEADLRSDIYSLGVIAYEMLAGQPPISAKRTGEYGMKLLNWRLTSLRKLNPAVNVVIEAAILRALEKDPHNRQQRALDFKQGLLKGVHLSG